MLIHSWYYYMCCIFFSNLSYLQKKRTLYAKVLGKCSQNKNRKMRSFLLFSYTKHALVYKTQPHPLITPHTHSPPPLTDGVCEATVYVSSEHVGHGLYHVLPQRGSVTKKGLLMECTQGTPVHWVEGIDQVDECIKIPGRQIENTRTWTVLIYNSTHFAYKHMHARTHVYTHMHAHTYTYLYKGWFCYKTIRSPYKSQRYWCVNLL